MFHGPWTHGPTIRRWASRAGRRARVGAQADEVLERAGQEDVEPAAQVDDGRVDLAVLVGDVPAPPERAVVGVGQEVVVPVVQAPPSGLGWSGSSPVPARQLRQGLVEHALPARVLLGTARQPGQVVAGPPERPLEHEGQLEGAAAVDPLGVVVGRGLADVHGAQVRRASRGQPVLGRAGVGAADGADVAVAPGLGGHPLHGVVAVAVLAPAVVVEGDEVALGGEAAAHVLDDDGVALGGEEGRRADLALGGVVLAVGGALEEGRERARALGQVDVGVEDASRRAWSGARHGGR